MPSRTEATRAKAALCATGRLTLLRLFSTLPVCSPILQETGPAWWDHRVKALSRFFANNPFKALPTPPISLTCHISRT